jgi:hypothetical protein
MSERPFTLVRNPAEPAPGLADRGLKVLMRLAVDQVGVCLEAISSGTACEHDDLAGALGSLADAIRTAAMIQAFGDLALAELPVPARSGTRHLQVVQRDAQ